MATIDRFKRLEHWLLQVGDWQSANIYRIVNFFSMIFLHAER